MFSILLVTSCFIFLHGQQAFCAQSEEKLFNDLLANYNVLGRPQHEEALNKPIKVHLKFSLVRLIELDSKNQVARFYAWLEYLWTDAKLRWNPLDYGNISEISMPIGKVWRPELFLYNAVDSQFDFGYPTNIFLNFTGFPFDEQYCFLEFAPWTYSAHQMALQSNAERDFSIKSYVPNGEWDLYVPYTSYDCCPKVPFSGLTFFMHFRRRTLYYMFNMILPSLIITAISLLSFVLPPESGDKTAIQIAVLLSICFFFSILSSMLPTTSEAVPLLGLFFFACMLIVAASLCCTVYVLNLHYKDMPMGHGTRVLLLHWLPWALRIKRPDRHKLEWAALPPLFQVPTKNAKEFEASCSDQEKPNEYEQILPELTEVEQQLKMISQQMMKQSGDEGKNAEIDWHFAARVLDRLFLWLFGTLIGASIAILLIRAPYLMA